MNEITRKTLEQVVQDCGRYPIEAFEFVRAGLNFTVQKIHGEEGANPDKQCHVSGQDLCQGLRQFALQRYGVLAKSVLIHWHIKRTDDFGKIVFAMVESKLMQKTDDDELADFVNVYDFSTAFDPPVRPSIRHSPPFAV